MAVSVVGYTQAASAGGDNVSCTPHGNTAENDFMVAAAFNDGNAAAVGWSQGGPGGWTRVDSQHVGGAVGVGWLGYRWADAADNATSFNWDSNGGAIDPAVGIITLRGVAKHCHPISAYAAAITTPASASVVAPAVTPLHDDCLLLAIWGARTGVTGFTVPGSMTEQFDITAEPGSNTSYGTVACGTEQLTGGAGASTGTRTGTANASRTAVGWTLAIAPDLGYTPGATPTWVGAGTAGTDTATAYSVTATLPAHNEGDLLFCLALADGSSEVFSITSGWTPVDPRGTQNNTIPYGFTNSVHTNALWWKIAGASEGNPTVTSTDPTSLLYVQTYAFRGVTTYGTPYDQAANFEHQASTTPTSRDIQTPEPNRLLAVFSCIQDDTTFSSGYPPSGWTSRDNVSTTDGNDARLVCMTKEAAASGLQAAETIGTLGVSEQWTSWTLSLIPAYTDNQRLKPSADSADGAWTTHAAGTDLAAQIDDDADSDYIRSETSPASSACRVKLGSGTDPGVDTGHEIRWRVSKDSTGGGNINMTVKLYQGGGNTLGAGTLIATRDRNNVTSSFTAYTETLLTTEADDITDYTDLYLEFHANQV